MLAFDTNKPPVDTPDMRRKRYRTATRGYNPHITEGRRRVLHLLYRYKFLRSSHIYAHLDDKSESQVRCFCIALVDGGLIRKLTEKDCDYINLFRHDIFTITDKGLKEISDDLPKVTADSGAMSMNFRKDTRHSLMICDTLSNIELGAKKAGVRFITWSEVVKDLDFETDPFCWSNVEYVWETKDSRQKRKSKETKPDGFFGLEYPDGRKRYFVIEAEFGTPNEPEFDKRASSRSSTKKKYLVWSSIIRNKLFSHLGIRNLSVLVIAPSPTVVKNHVAVLERLYGKSAWFLHGWVPVGGNPKPCPELFSTSWLRAGLPEGYINVPPDKVQS